MLLNQRQKKTCNQLGLIDDTLEKMKLEIKILQKHADDQKVDKKAEESDVRKQCRFDNKGYCRESQNCQFSHSDTIRQVYLEN